MRSKASVVTVLVIALLLTAVGCQPRTPAAATDPSASWFSKTLLATQTDEQLMSRYIEGLDIVFGGSELVFSDASTIPSQTLFMFFVHATLQDKLYTPDNWLNKSDSKYHIPLDAVTATIDKYFSGAKFDPTKVQGYVPASNEFVTPLFGGFGGGRFIKLRAKEAITADTVRLTADFYDGESFKNIVYTKIYTIQIGAGGYKYLSITKP